MTEGIEKRLIRPAETVEGVSAAIAVLLGMWFAVVLVLRAGDALIGWGFEFQSIGDFLGLEKPHEKILGWDRSFLLLAGAFAGFALAGIVGEFVQWARKSPEQRRKDREAAKRVLVKQKEAEREAKAARKEARKPMSGWRRLWIVLSILFGALAFWIAYETYSRASSYVTWNGDNEAFWSAAHADPSLSNCDWGTAEAKYPIGGDYLVSCDTADPWLFALLWALFPAAFMAVVGLTVRWIYRGFRHRTGSD